VIELDTAETASSLEIADENVRARRHHMRLALAQRLEASMHPYLEIAMPELWRFDGDRCARMLAAVMTRIANP
jgi:hypothetical protein